MSGAPMDFEQVDVVVPVYRNRETLRDLYHEVLDAMAGWGLRPRFVIVDDACPEGSAEVLAGLDPQRIAVLRQPANTGQQAAVRRGLSVCGSHTVIVMDADLQDPPEIIPKLLVHLREGGYDAVFATRRGDYQSGMRMLAARAFRTVVRRLVPLPAGAGGYVAMSAPLVRRLNQSANPRFYLAGLIGCHSRSIGAVPAERRTRRSGRSAYTGTMRWSVAVSNIMCILHEKSRHAAFTSRTQRT